MSGLEFASALVGALAWPTAVVVCAVLFRRPLRNLLQRLDTLEAPGGIKVKFDDQLAGVEETVAAVARSSRPALGSPTTADDDAGWGVLLGRAGASPRDAVLDAWVLLEGQLNVACDRVDPTCQNGWPQVEGALSRLAQWPALRPAVVELRNLRDATVRGTAAPSPGDAVRYVSAARDVVTTLEMALPARPGPLGNGVRASDPAVAAEENRRD